MSIRSRLDQLELRVQPPPGSDCIYRKMPPNTDPIGDFFRAKFGDEEAKQRLSVWESLGVCHCEACEKGRREQEADPTYQEIHRFLEARFGSHDATEHVCECDGPKAVG